MSSVLFVCLGNICRSPLAEGVFLHQAAEASFEVEVDSAGTGGYHAGELADPRSRAVAQKHGIQLPIRARKVKADDFGRFDLIVAMDQSNARNLRAIGSHLRVLGWLDRLRRRPAWLRSLD